MKNFIKKETRHQAKRQAMPKRKMIVIVAIVVVAMFIIGASFAAWQQRSSRNVDLAQNGSPQPVDSRDRQPEGAVEESIARAAQGDYSGAQQILEEEAVSASDEEAHDILLQQSANAYNEQEYKESLTYAERAIEKQETSRAYKLAGRSAEKLSQNNVAVEYYRKALDTLPQDSGTRDSSVRDLEDSIRRTE